MILSDRDIKERLWNPVTSTHPGMLEIRPFVQEQLQPSSYDVRLSDKLFSYDKSVIVIDPEDPKTLVGETTQFRTRPIYPDQFLLGSTQEYIEIPGDLVGRIEGKSSLGRLGLQVHITAGYIDPGFRGYLTLELHNINYRPILLSAGMLIAQLSFSTLLSPAERIYGHPDLKSRYQAQQSEPVPAKAPVLQSKRSDNKDNNVTVA